MKEILQGVLAGITLFVVFQWVITGDIFFEYIVCLDLGLGFLLLSVKEKIS